MDSELKIMGNNAPKIFALIILILLIAPVLWLFYTYTNVLPASLLQFKIVIVAILTGTILFAIYAIFKQLNLNKPVLIINNEGITDNSAFASIGFIPWKDIEGFEIASNSLKSKLLKIKVTKPDEYAFKGGTTTKNKVLRNYFNTFGSPVVISAVSIKYELDDLMKTLDLMLIKYKSIT